jgi:hypothetical protein
MCKDLGDLRARLLERVPQAHDLVFVEERGHQRRDQPGIVDRIGGERVGSTLRPPSPPGQLADGYLASDDRRCRPGVYLVPRLGGEVLELSSVLPLSSADAPETPIPDL